MKRQIGKRLLCGLLTLVMMLSLVPVTAAAATSGYCGADGANVQWTLYDDGTMTIYGIGAMKDFGNTDDVPWYSNRRQIKKVVVKSGVTHIGDGAFSESTVESVEIPDTVASIGDWTFVNCVQLTQVILPEGVKTIGFGAFASCQNLKTVVLPKSLKTINNDAFSSSLETAAYCGTEEDWAKVTGGGKEFLYANDKVTFGVTKTDSGHYSRYIPCKPAHTSGDICGDIYGKRRIPGVKAHYACVLCSVKYTDQGCTTQATDEDLRIAAADSFTLSQESFVYDGKPKYPTVIIKDTDGNTLVKDRDYEVTYDPVGVQLSLPAEGDFRTLSTGRAPIRVGHHEVMVDGKGNYNFRHVLNFEITKDPAAKQVKKVALSATTYTYDGKVKTPAVTVVDTDGEVLVKNRDYTVTYASGRKYVGTYKVLVKGTGRYSFSKTLSFKIIPTKTALTKLTAKSKSFVAQWSKKTAQVTGYQVQYSLKKDFSSGVKTVTVSKNSVVSKTIKSLKAGRSYYVRIRTYKTARGVNYYSGWSKVLRVKTK